MSRTRKPTPPLCIGSGTLLALRLSGMTDKASKAGPSSRTPVYHPRKYSPANPARPTPIRHQAKGAKP
jgi:hypothetical protein